MERVTVSARALHEVLTALVGGGYLIRELQATREPKELFADNPINILVEEYNTAATRPAEVGGDGWLPIEMAETNISVSDPPRCLVYGPEVGVQFGAVWKRADGTARGRAEGFQGDWKITHFRPEPGAPLE